MRQLYILLLGIGWPVVLLAQPDLLPPALAHAPDTTRTRALRHLGDSLVTAGLRYKSMGQYVRSEQVFRQALAYANKANDDLMRGYTQASLPYALIPQNKLDEAEHYCRLALDWVERTGTAKFSMSEDIYSHLSRIWEKRGDNKQALLFYKRQMANHDSVFNEMKNRQITELETRYQTRQKEDHIKQLDATNAHQSRQIWAGVSGLVLLSLLLGTTVWQYQRIRHSHAKIQQQSDQLSLMMRELHHRVKNNLAIVSSLLKLQSNRLEDEKAVAAVRTGQQRVEAMSLIHQRLYQTDRVAKVNIREYLTDLAESLMQAYGYDRREFDLAIEVDHQELDVDVAMPLGLIANELITNAFKYAYSDNQRPLLRIGLRSHNGRLTLDVQDNGPGVDETDWQHGSRASFGKRLIASLSEQLDGQFELTKQNGTLFRLYVPHNRLRTT